LIRWHSTPAVQPAWRLLYKLDDPLPMTVGDLMSFGQICLVEIGALPDALACRITELRTPEHYVA
jgi:hypothetical protein